MGLLYNYKLQKRLEKLEYLIYEKTSWRGEPSKAYLIWKYLMDNGPSSTSTLKREFPPKISSDTAIKFFVDNNLLYKNGDTVSANADYSWDDVGVIPRTAQQEQIINTMNDNSSVEEEPVRSRTRTPRVRQVKQNLFSKKLEEVKAAVEAGQDVNQENDKEQTPLMFALNAKNADNLDIIQYLLQNGADITSTYRGYDAYGLACKNNKEEAARIILINDTYSTITKPMYLFSRINGGTPSDSEFVMTASTKERGAFDSSTHLLYYRIFLYGTITLDQYEQAISTIINNSNIDNGVSGLALNGEFERNIFNTYKCFADKYHRLPVTFLNQIERFSINIKRNLLEYFKKALDGKLRSSLGISDFIDQYTYLCNELNEQPDLSNVFSSEILRNQTETQIRRLIYNLVHNNDVSTLRKIVNSGVKISLSAAVDECSSVSDDNIARLILKLANKERPSVYDFRSVAQSKNKYLVEYFIDNGYAEDIMYECISSIVTGDSLCIKVLIDNGYEFPRGEEVSNFRSNVRNKRNIQNYIDKIVAGINRDEINRDLLTAIEQNPDIMNSKEIANAIKSNDNVTSRQIQRILDRNNVSQSDTYDM